MRREEYRIIPTRHFQRDFDRLDAQTQRRVLEAIERNFASRSKLIFNMNPNHSPVFP